MCVCMYEYMSCMYVLVDVDKIFADDFENTDQPTISLT